MLNTKNLNNDSLLNRNIITNICIMCVQVNYLLIRIYVLIVREDSTRTINVIGIL